MTDNIHKEVGDEFIMKINKNAKIVDNYIFERLKPKKPEALYEASIHIFQAGGKRLRPFLVMKACEIVGGNTGDALPFAAALEILHNFTLIHDDIMDNDPLRRGSPTVHTKWGIPIAIASGDLLFAKVYEAIYSSLQMQNIPHTKIVECIRRVTEAAIAMCEGQVLDVLFPDISNISEDDYISMVEGKTSALFKACTEVGAIIGGAHSEQVESLGSFAWNAGIAFQIVDDILGVTADEKIIGKPIGSDLREGKKTLILIYALKNANSDERNVILKVLDVKKANSENIEAAINAVVATGAIKYAQKIANEYSKKAKKALNPFPESQAKKDLLEMIDYFTLRSY